MGEFQSLGTMDRHQANCIFGFVHLKRDDASRLAEVFQVVDELLEIGCPINLLFFPFLPKVRAACRVGEAESSEN